MPRNRDIELDPRLFVPPNVIDVRQENKELYDYVYVNAPEVIADEGPTLESPNSPIPNAPTTYSIKSQTIRNTPDGRAVVDLVLEFPDIGVYSVDVKVTPA